MSIEFGNRVAEARRLCGYTQSNLAELADVSTNHISAVERGLYEIRTDTLERLANALGTTTDYLIYGGRRPTTALSKVFIKVNKLCESDQDWIADYIEILLKINQER